MISTDVLLPPYHPFLAADVPWLLERSARANADHPFIVWEPFEGAPRRWTYAQALADVRRIAAGLAARGVKAGDAVLLHLENSPESVLTWLACAEMGAVGVTTNARSSGEELAYFAERSGAVGIITQPKFAEVAGAIPNLRFAAIAAPGDDSLLGQGDPPVVALGPAHPFSVQFTSGTTSRPKPVLWTHANGLWGAMVNARHLQMAPHDVSLVSHPLFHTVAQAWQVLASIWVGACVVIVPKFSASRFWDVVTRNGCTRCTMGQFHARALADQHVPSSHPLRYNQPGVSLTSSPRFFEIKGYGAYGMTELISQPIFNDPMSVLDEGSIGRPAPEYEVRLVKETGELAGPGEVGELQVRGVRGLSIFAEYLADPTATAEAFTADGFFRTGDLVQLRPDGAFAFADRLKDMLKVGGENVAASEIEQVIRSEEGVQEVAVVAAPHPMLAEVPVAFVIPTPDAPIDLAERILQACAQRLADFKRPHRVRLVPSLPRSLVNKVAKAELRAQLRAETAGTAEAHSGLSSAGLAGVPVSR